MKCYKLTICINKRIFYTWLQADSEEEAKQTVLQYWDSNCETNVEITEIMEVKTND